jgi:translation initiation factor IF-1
MEVNYIDFYDSASNTIEVGAGAAIVANTGSITLDRDVYPVPFDASVTSNANYAFLDQAAGAQSTHTGADDGDVTVYAWIDDADYDQSPTGQDQIAATGGNTISGTACGDCGPVVVKIYRGSDYRIQATAGNDIATTNSIKSDGTTAENRSELGPITETEASSGVFELEFTLGHDSSYSQTASTVIKQGDILTVEYTDPTDASGDSTYLATDSATFDLRTGVLTSDKSVYVIGQDVILSIIDDDLNLDSDSTETYGLDLIEWDSDAAEVLLDSTSSFDPEPNGLRETGSNTGVFQTVIEFPSTLSSTALDRGEVVDLEYVDYGPSGADFYNDDTEDIGLSISSSNFGATIELDQKVYSWSERVFITITAPDHNFDTALVDEIGNTSSDPITVATRDTKLTTYKLLETGEDTGIFYGEVTLTGFAHDADGDADTGNSSGHDRTCTASNSGAGPTNGELCANDEDGVTVSFEYTEDSTVIGSALIRWNIGEAQWLDSSYSAGGSGTVRIVDPDMDLHADYVDNFKVDVWSDSDSGGIDLTITETSEMSGVFEGSVFFTTTDESSGHRLRVSEGDTVTIEYEDNTLPNPYNTSDELEIAGTAIIGTIVPPLDRAPAANARVVDAFGNSLSEVSVDQQVQIEADLVNGTDGDQEFAYLVQVQDGSGVTVSLAWITGSLSAGQSFSPALSWIPSASGSYEATVFVWESVDNPSALSDTVSVSIDVV